MSTSDNKTSKTLENPLDVPSRPAVAAKMRDDTTVPVALYKKIPAIKKSGSRRNG